MKRCVSHNSPARRRGNAMVLVVVTLPVLLGAAALAIDVGHVYTTRCALQNAADASALAAASQLVENFKYDEVRLLAQEFATTNHSGHGSILPNADVTFGFWDWDSETFSTGGPVINAVRTVTRRTSQNGIPVGLFFAGLFGLSHTDISATATAFMPTLPLEFLVPLLLDEDIINPNVPVLEDLADQMGISSDELISDLDGDDYIDLPPGIYELPTGQVGDEGLFAIGEDFPFSGTSNPSLGDFLLFEEGGNQHGISKSDLDALLGVEPVSDPADYLTFGTPQQILVSPVYKGDISDTEPGVNGLGERRGLLAYKIISHGVDPDGGGSVFPNLIIEVFAPQSLNPPSEAQWTGFQPPQLVE